MPGCRLKAKAFKASRKAHGAHSLATMNLDLQNPIHQDGFLNPHGFLWTQIGTNQLIALPTFMGFGQNAADDQLARKN
jgi:hypothetical protein